MHALRLVSLVSIALLLACSDDGTAGTGTTGAGSAAATMTTPASTSGVDDGQDDNASPPDPSAPDDGDEMPADSTGGPAGDDCCAEHAGMGCNDPAIESCVCEEDAVCCTFQWDALCVNTARNRCGACGGGGLEDTGGTTLVDPSGTDTGDTDVATTAATSSSTDPTAGGEACCQPTQTPGCPGDPELESCVCGMDAYCCDNEWDGICVQGAIERCGAACQFGEGCCEVHPAPGCDDGTVQTCVCMVDPFCCDEQWDMLCVDQVESEGCGNC